MKERLCDMMSSHRCNHSRTRALINKSTVNVVSAHRDGEKERVVIEKIIMMKREKVLDASGCEAGSNEEEKGNGGMPVDGK